MREPEGIDRSNTPSHPSFQEAFFVWLKIGLLSFGGPSGQIALMHEELVERRRWVSESRFLHALNYCMLLPGPEAQQLSVYIGWLLHRTWGGIMAGTLFILPGAIFLTLISWIYVSFGQVPWIEAIFYGLKPAVIGIVAFAVFRIGRKALKNAALWSIAGGAFVGIYFLHIPYPLIILTAALIGMAGGQWTPRWFQGPGDSKAKETASVIVDEAGVEDYHRPTLWGSVRTIAIWAMIWVAPVAASWGLLGRNHVLTQEGLFFSKAAVITFGGAYAVLPFVGQQAVEVHGWLSPAQMMDGMALAETTPGPLILVLQFVGYLGGYNTPTQFTPKVSALLGTAMTLWVTFAPCFLFVLAGAPFIEALRGQKRINYALSAITAAVVGVILNLAVWFALHILFPSTTGSGIHVDWFSLILSGIVLYGLIRLKLDVLIIISGCGLLGLLFRFLF